MKGGLMELAGSLFPRRSAVAGLVVACVLSALGGGLADPGVLQAAEGQAIEVVARDPAGHGLLCKSQRKTILLVAGTPDQMGTAHGTLLGKKMGQLFRA